MKKKVNDVKEFIPVFRVSFLKPRYWGTWLALGACIGMTLLPGRIRDPVLGTLGRTIGRFSRNARRRAQINLFYCMPELTWQQRESIIDNMFAVAPQSIVMMAELALSKSKRIRHRVIWHGKEVINQLQATKQNVIFLVPHTWAIDIPAMLLAAEGQAMVIIIRRQKNQLLDYAWNSLRLRFGGRIHIRDNGIKPFIKSVQAGYWGYYLPDQDHGTTQSEFVDFFATYKATLPAIGRMMKLCRARVVPLFPVYNNHEHRLDIFIRPPMDDLSAADKITQARRMNEEIEKFIRPNPEHYSWTLKLLKTRKAGEEEPYQRTDMFPR